MLFKTKIIFVGLIGLLAATVGSISMAEQSNVIELKVNQRVQIDLIHAGELDVKVASNPSTGFSWELKSVSQLNHCLTIKQNHFEMPDASSGRVGVSGFQHWTIKSQCKKPSQTVLRFEYSRPWESGVPAVSWSELLVELKP